MVSKQEIERINSISVVEVAKALGINVLRGNKAMCFSGHDSKSPSLSFNIKKNYWYCFGCAQGGGNINLVQKVRNYNFTETIGWLRTNFLRGEIISRLRRPPLVPQQPKQNSIFLQSYRNRPDIEVYEWIIQNSTLSQNSLEHLHDVRGFTDKTIKHFQVKDLAEPKEFLNKLIKKWGVDRLQKCGLLSKGKCIPPYWDYSLWFPFFENGRIIYLQRRRFADDGPKYVNLSDMSKPYYNIDILAALNPNDSVYICEGIPDTIIAHQIGWNAIGVLGATSVNENLVKILLPYQVVAIPDTDEAGTKFYQKIKGLFSQSGKIIERLYLKDSKDFCEYIKKEFQ